VKVRLSQAGAALDGGSEARNGVGAAALEAPLLPEYIEIIQGRSAQ